MKAPRRRLGHELRHNEALRCLLPFARYLWETDMAMHQVDLDQPDNMAFPEFAALPFCECVLEPGQMLYVPPRWWHYVKALTISFSVSFWWQ